MSDSIPSSPVLSSSNDNTTENTRLLNTPTANYNNREATTKQTVITMSPSDHQEATTNSYLYNGGGLSVTTSRYYNSIITAGQPVIPTQQLTEKIQDILVFTEIKKNQQARAIIEEKKQKARDQQQQFLQQQQQQQQFTPIPVQYPSSDSDSSDSDSDSDSGSVRFTLKKKLSEWSIDGSKKKTENGKKALRKRDYAVDALHFATDKWKEKHGWSTGSNNSSSEGLLPAVSSKPLPVTTSVVDNVQSNGNGLGIVQQKKKPEQQFKGIPSSAESVYDVAKNASVCAVLALLHERRQSSGLSTETDISLQALALSTLNLGLKVQDTSATHVVLYEMLTNKWMHGKSGKLHRFFRFFFFYLFIYKLWNGLLKITVN